MEINEYILLQVDKPVYTYHFHPNSPLVLGKNPRIGLKSVFLWYTIPNISPRYDNNHLKVKYNGEWKDIVIPEGMYEIDKLNECINRIVLTGQDIAPLNTEEEQKVLEISVDKSTFHCLVKLSAKVEIDLTNGKLYDLLGLEARIYNRPEERGKNFLNITRGIDEIFIRCNLVDRTFQPEISDVLFDLMPSDPGRAIIKDMDHPIEFYKCKNQHIRSIEIRITDRENNPLYLNETSYIKINFKYVDIN